MIFMRFGCGKVINFNCFFILEMFFIKYGYNLFGCFLDKVKNVELF